MTYWPEDPYGDMAPMLQASIEAAKMRHPSGKIQGATMVTEPIVDEAFPTHPPNVILTAADRCDKCGAVAAYRAALIVGEVELLFCGHHWRANSPAILAKGWMVVAVSAEATAGWGDER